MSKKLLLLALAAFLLVPLMASPAFSFSADDIASAVNTGNADNNQERLDITTFPWTEDFEGATFPPTDWYLYYPEPTNEIIQDTTFNVTPNGSYCLRFSSYNPDTTANPYVQYARTPMIQLPSTMTYPTLEFFAKRYISIGVEELYMAIGTTTDVENWTGWIDASAIIAGDTDWHKITGDLTQLVGQSFYVGFKYYGDYQYYVGLDDVSIYDAAIVGGTVTLSGTENVENVVVTCGTKTTSPDAIGLYAFTFKTPGTYDMTADLPGYPQWTQTGVVATAGAVTQVDINMQASTTFTVSGVVDGSDATGTGLDGVEIMIYNENFSYSGTTDASGNYSISNVVANELFNVVMTKDGYQDYTSTVTLTGDHTLDVTLTEDVTAPEVVTATQQGSDVEVEWIQYLDEFAHDTGNVTGQLGFQTPSANSVMGTAFNNQADLYKVSWYLTDNGGPHASVSICIFGLDANGVPDVTDLLYQSPAVANTDLQWNTYVLPQVVSAPNGFFVGVNYSAGFVALALDDHDQTNYTAGTQYAIYDFSDATAAPSDISGSGFYGHFLMRAYGMDNGATRSDFAAAPAHVDNNITLIENNNTYFAGSPQVATAMTRSLEDFSVYRFAEADMDTPANWTMLSDNETGDSYTDDTFSTLPGGLYYYAVVANYTSAPSAATISNWVAADMDAQVTVELITDSFDPVTGAEVTLSEVDGDHSYSANVTAGNSITFPAVWRSHYDVRVSLDNHSMEFPIENYDCTSDSVTIVVSLVEDRMALDYMTATVNGSGIDLEWFAVQEGFENVLLVDDDASSYNTNFVDVAPAYQTLFGNLGINLSVHDVAAADADGPDAATMLPYDLVIWDTGSNFTNGASLSDNDHTNLAAYLNNGGKLILSAPEYLYDRFSGLGAFSAGDFPYDYLGVASAVQDDITLTASAPLIGAAGSYVDGFSVNQGVNLHIQDMDTLVPNANGTVFATVISGGNFDIAVQTSNTIFFAGSLSGLEDGTNTVVEFMTAALEGLAGASRNDRAFAGYTIMRNGEELASGIQATTYTDDAPLNGTNTYEVYADYTSGTSNTVTVDAYFVGNDENINQFKDEVYGNYPNPFNPTTAIKFSLAKADDVEIEIYNIKGQKVKSLLNEKRDAGQNSVVWNGTDDTNKSVGSGVYFYKIKASTFSKINKMIMLK